MKTQHITYLSLGTNKGNKLQNLQNAIDLIANGVGNIKHIASVYKTPALGFNGNNFLNTVVAVNTYLTPEILMQKLLAIENRLGRIRLNNKTYTNRSIDIDILLFNNQIISSKNLTIPHPKMIDRKFVLVPLLEIAKNIIHPLTQKPLQNYLKTCKDTSPIHLIKEKLKHPLPINKRYNYIAIEGNIGVGKTSLTHLLTKNLNAKTILERFADNPFLPKFYANNERYAFPLEMSFLTDRYQQFLDDLAKFDLFKNLLISDYHLSKSLLFANITLKEDEYKLYKKVFNIMYKEITKPDLYIYLYQNTDRLLENIKKRGRSYEQNISASYLQKIHDGYINFINTQQNLNSLVIDVSTLDFIHSEEDYQFILQKIKNN